MQSLFKNYCYCIYSLQVIPSTKDLVKISRCDCAVSDILRMECLILDKLNWSVKTITAIDYLHIVSLTGPFYIMCLPHTRGYSLKGCQFTTYTIAHAVCILTQYKLWC